MNAPMSNVRAAAKANLETALNQHPSTEQIRRTCEAGLKEFDAKLGDLAANDTRPVSEVIDSALRKGIPREDSFNWQTDPSVVIKRQPAVAIYFQDGDTVIRQQAEWCEENDTILILADGHEHRFLDALCEHLGVGNTGR